MRLSYAILLLSVLIRIPQPVLAQKPVPESRNLAWAQEFLKKMYPEMNYHKYVMTATTSHPFDVTVQSMGNLSIQVGEMAPGTILGIAASGAIVGQDSPKDRNYGPIPAKQFINANFGFDEAGHLATFAAEGPAVGRQTDYDGVKQLVGFHPEWTDAQDISALLKAGALYGPEEKDKFLDVIRVEELKKLFGNIDIVSTKFETMTDNDQRFPLLHWVVIVNISFSEGNAGTYRMFFEPFKGTLTEMEAISPL
jgi:hypothetical protein